MLPIEGYEAFLVMAYITGARQISLFQFLLEELIPKNHLVRIIPSADQRAVAVKCQLGPDLPGGLGVLRG